MAETLNTAIKRMKFDNRMLDYNLKQGFITTSEYEEYLSSLNDLSESSKAMQFNKLVSPHGEEDELSQQEDEENETGDNSNPESPSL